MTSERWVVITVAAALVVMRPLPEGRWRFRVADHGVANEITFHLASRLESQGRREEALALLENHSSWRVVVDKGRLQDTGHLELRYTLFRQKTI